MNLKENIKVGWLAIKGNGLRTTLTALIIAIGIMSLVGIITAVESIKASFTSNFADLEANSFEIEQKGNRGRHRGREEKTYPPITYREAIAYKELLSHLGSVSISTFVSGATEVKYLSNKTNPNSFVVGGDENYVIREGYEFFQGRNFSKPELENGSNNVIIGYEIADKLFKNEQVLGAYISLLGRKFKVVGVLDKKGNNFGGGSSDRILLVPLENARRLAANRTLSFEIVTKVNNPAELQNVLAEAKGVMRRIRQDPIGAEDSFEIAKSETLGERLDNVSGYLKIGGVVIGIITLIGASTGLMNIMMVSVTERTREIGVRKALGATPKRIKQQFLIEALLVCQLGGMGGVLLGVLIGNLISLLIGAGSFVIPWFWIFIGLLISFMVGIISGYYPSHKAARLDPIESLRFE